MATKVSVNLKLEGKLQGSLILAEADLSPEYLAFLDGFQKLLADYEGTWVANGIRLVDAGTNKIQVIKAVRTITDAGLKESKDFIEATGNRHIQASALYTVGAMIQMLSEVGAKAEPVKCSNGCLKALSQTLGL